MPDIQITVAQSLADEMISAIPFPLRLFIPVTGSLVEDASTGEGFVEPEQVMEWEVDSGAPDDSVTLMATSDWERAIAEAALNYTNHPQKFGTLPPNELKALKAVASLLDGSEQSIEEALLKLQGATESQIKDLLKAFDFKWSHHWTKINIEKRPKVKLGVPIEASNVRLWVQVKGRACVKILLGWVCVTITSPNMLLEGRKAFLDLSLKNGRLTGAPRFDQIKLVWVITIFGIKIRIKIGVTGLVNGELAKAPIELGDLAALADVPIPFSSKRLTLKSATVTGKGKLVLNLDLEAA